MYFETLEQINKPPRLVFEAVDMDLNFAVVRNLWAIRVEHATWWQLVAVYTPQFLLLLPAIIADILIMFLRFIGIPVSIYLLRTGWEAFLKLLIALFKGAVDIIKGPANRFFGTLAFAGAVLSIYILIDSGLWKTFYELFLRGWELVSGFLA